MSSVNVRVVATYSLMSMVELKSITPAFSTLTGSSGLSLKQGTDSILRTTDMPLITLPNATLLVLRQGSVSVVTKN